MRKFITLISMLFLVVCASYAQTTTTQTTLAANVTSTGATTIRVALATGFTANTTYLMVDNEAMAVTSVNGTTIGVSRGYGGTPAGLHSSGAVVYVGPNTAFVSMPQDPAGRCVANNYLYNPVINFRTGSRLHCTNSEWVVAKTQRTQFGSVATSALLFGAGTSTTQVTTSTADRNFIGLWLGSSAASGDNRGMYLRYYLSGGGGGEAARIYTTVSSNSTATAHGSHTSLSFGASAGTVTGLGVASRSTLHIPDRAITIGTAAPVQAEVYMDGTSSSPTATALSLFRGVVDGGDATAKNKLGYVMDLSGLGAGVFDNQSSWSVSKVLKILVNGTVYYLPLSTAK